MQSHVFEKGKKKASHLSAVHIRHGILRRLRRHKNLSLYYLLEEYVYVLEHGISVGAVATLLYVLYEQFVRDKKTPNAAEGVISTLIEGYVPSNRVQEVTKLIADAIEKDVTGNGAERAAKILAENTEGAITEHDIRLLSGLIIETLAKINVK